MTGFIGFDMLKEESTEPPLLWESRVERGVRHGRRQRWRTREEARTGHVNLVREVEYIERQAASNGSRMSQ